MTTVTFYSNTKIEDWQSREKSALRVAFQESRRRHTLSRGDRQLPSPKFRSELLAVNSFSRRIWGEVVSREVSRFFCDGGDGATHNRDVLFVSLVDITCARSPEDRLTDADLEFIRRPLRYGLKGYSYLGMIEPAYYVNLQHGVRYTGKRCLFWHLHALVWGVSRKELKTRLRKLVKAGRYVAISDGSAAADVRQIKQGRLPAHVAYILKSPCKAYRVSVLDRKDKLGRPITDADGVVMQRFKQGKLNLRHGDRIVLFHAMKQLHLDKLTVAGGEGKKLVRTAKRMALRDETAILRGHLPGPTRRKGWRALKRGGGC
jgi:hypothetical protein